MCSKHEKDEPNQMKIYVSKFHSPQINNVFNDDFPNEKLMNIYLHCDFSFQHKLYDY